MKQKKQNKHRHPQKLFQHNIIPDVPISEAEEANEAEEAEEIE
jgi:hypothetical protein